MKIITKQYEPRQLNESDLNEVNKIYESYNRSRSVAEFLMENGNTEENVLLCNFMSLNETVINDDMKFTFENGMYIPNISPKSTGRLSLYNIMQESKTEQEFVNNVSENLCLPYLGFNASDNDRINLAEVYNKHKNL